jgi:hypothetical protein
LLLRGEGGRGSHRILMIGPIHRCHRLSPPPHLFSTT